MPKICLLNQRTPDTYILVISGLRLIKEESHWLNKFVIAEGFILKQIYIALLLYGLTLFRDNEGKI